MSGSKLGIYKAKTGFGKKAYTPGAMISKMNKGNAKKMTAGAGSGVGRLQKAGMVKAVTKAAGKRIIKKII